MDSEGDLIRPVPAVPYRPSGIVLLAPLSAIAATERLLQRAGRRESAVMWYGMRDAQGNARVSHVIAPKQTMSWGNYSIAANALAQAVHRLPQECKALAQIHSHPGLHVEHSNYDDRMISSTKLLSIVFPHYGRTRDPFPHGIGVHEWQHGYWHLLALKDSQRRIQVADQHVSVEDLR